MYIEKEIKILNIEYAVLVHHLEALWAKRTEPTTVRDRYYDSYDKILRNKKQRLRLRSQWDTTVITQKTKIPNKFMKSMTEQDIIVESTEKWHQLLQDLWLQSIKYKEKTRISYQIDDILVFSLYFMLCNQRKNKNIISDRWYAFWYRLLW